MQLEMSSVSVCRSQTSPRPQNGLPFIEMYLQSVRYAEQRHGPGADDGAMAQLNVRTKDTALPSYSADLAMPTGSEEGDIPKEPSSQEIARVWHN